MSFSPSSSSSSESYSPKSPSSLQNFDPFAVHPFTNCSHVGRNSPSYNGGNKYANVHPANYNSQFNTTAPQTPSLATPSNPARSQTTSYGYQPSQTAIFEQFRKETSTPDLDAVLRSNKSPAKPASSSSGTYTPSKPIPIAQPRKI
ncbi:hypothetical protein CPC08DRAFT_714149 [Agrocybe pediades]|nr:hypothetical protein CPC08DRAFT_714149 [Agrocybe pediades]